MAAGLSDQISGRVVTAGDDGWDEARRAFNLTVDQRPALVAEPASAEDVGAVVRFARENGLGVAPQRTGHNARPIGPMEEMILLHTRGMGGVEIEADGPSARANGGAQWMELVPKASEIGLAALHGSAPDIGIAGYTLGGGVGWYSRKLGLAANRVTAVEVVNAEGELVRTDADNEPELFWALRGGGGNFGVVTAIEFDLFETGFLYAGALFFPYERSADILHAWREWIATVPEEVTSIGRMLQFPPLPEVPEMFRGESFGLVEISFLGTEEDGAELVAPLRELGPAMDTVAVVPPAALADLHMDPPDPVPYNSGHLLLDELPAKAIDDFVAAGGAGSGSSLISMEIRHLGGALGRPDPAGGCLHSIDADYLYFGVGLAADEGTRGATQESLAKLGAAFEPYGAGRSYLNFVEQSGDPSICWDEESYARLRKARAKYDPDGLFRANHAIAPTT